MPLYLDSLLRIMYIMLNRWCIKTPSSRKNTVIPKKMPSSRRKCRHPEENAVIPEFAKRISGISSRSRRDKRKQNSYSDSSKRMEVPDNASHFRDDGATLHYETDELIAPINTLCKFLFPSYSSCYTHYLNY